MGGSTKSGESEPYTFFSSFSMALVEKASRVTSALLVILWKIMLVEEYSLSSRSSSDS